MFSLAMTAEGQCDAEWLSDRLESAAAAENEDDELTAVIARQLIIVDCRPASDFAGVHIKGAVSLALPPLIQRRLLKGNLTMPVALGHCGANDGGSKVTDDQWKTNLIVLYDDGAATSQSDDVITCGGGSSSSKVVTLLLEHLVKDGYRACLLQGGFGHFRSAYPHLCTDRKATDVDSCLQTGFRNLRLSSATAAVQSEESPPHPPDGGTTTFPVEVLPHLYLGDAKNASDLECLEGKGIRYILNVTPNVPNKFEMSEEFKYLQIPIRDHWSQNLTTYFPQAITFIDEGRRLNRGVLVHCLAGISRSVTVTVAYLMYSMSLSLNDAYDYVKRRKPNVSPNLTFMGQLLDFENALRGGDQPPCHCGCHSLDSSSSCSSSSPYTSPASGRILSAAETNGSCASCACALTSAAMTTQTTATTDALSTPSIATTTSSTLCDVNCTS